MLVLPSNTAPAPSTRAGIATGLRGAELAKSGTPTVVRPADVHRLLDGEWQSEQRTWLTLAKQRICLSRGLPGIVSGHDDGSSKRD